MPNWTKKGKETKSDQMLPLRMTTFFLRRVLTETQSLAMTEQQKQQVIVENHLRTGSKATTIYKTWAP